MEIKKTFNLRVSTSKIGQIIKSSESNSSIRIHEGGIFDANTISSGSGYLHFTKPVKDIYAWLRKNFIQEFFLERTFSLGDLLLLIPVYRAFVRDGFRPYIRTRGQYVELLSKLEVSCESVDVHKTPETPGVFLDYVVERDHTDPKLQKIHRTKIYHDFMGVPYIEKELDWGFKLENFPEVSWDDKPYIIFQGRDAVDRRGLSTTVIQDLIYFMNLEGVRVLYIGESLPMLKGIDDLTRFQFMNSTLPELFSWIAGAKMLITMDSSPLWISHYTNTPTVAILGPSRPEERLSLHPLYPEQANAIRLNTWINCESCFEQSQKCNHTFKCLKNVNTDVLYKELRKELMKYWELG